MKYFLLHKWDFIKEKRKDFEALVQTMKRKRQFKKRWSRLLKSKKVIN